MTFRTEYKPSPRAFSLSVRRPLLLMGSCFTDNIGARMRESMWEVCANPCGTLFNPMSIARSLRNAAGGELRFADGFSWDFPTAFDSAEKCEDAFDKVREALTGSQALIATFGTAKVYFRDGEVVANCHKRPAREFEARMLSAEEMLAEWEALIADVLPPEMKVILTVSPVRHVKDGFETNALSKASLLVLCHRLKECFPARVEYFPAYEIVTDDLRDYRFYADDMVHPSSQAVDYLWRIFCEEFVPVEGREWLAEGAALTRRLNHRFLHPDSPEAAAFRAETASRLRAFLNR